MQFEIRSAETEDASAISDVLCQSITACCVADHLGDPETIARWLSNKTPENIKKWTAAPGSMAFVAQRSDRVIGIALVSGEELVLCYVVPQALYQGVGKALLQAAETQALTSGVEVLRLDSTRTALPFYRRNGFSVSGSPCSWAGLEAHPMCKRLLDRALPLADPNSR